MTTDYPGSIRAALAAVFDRYAPPPVDKPAWRTLPGNVMELADTGFQIRFNPTRQHDLVLINPEGLDIVTGRDWHLAEIKQHAERCASSRAEFVVVVATLPKFGGRPES